jgi:hypothetical protein
MKKFRVTAFVVVALGTVATAEAQMKYWDEQGITHDVDSGALAPPPHRNQAQPPTLRDLTAQGTRVAPAPSTTSPEPPPPPHSTNGVEQRIKEARQRQCNAEWERYHVAQARLCGLDRRDPNSVDTNGLRCDVHILGFEPSPFCR